MSNESGSYSDPSIAQEAAKFNAKESEASSSIQEKAKSLLEGITELPKDMRYEKLANLRYDLERFADGDLNEDDQSIINNHYSGFAQEDFQELLNILPHESSMR